MKTTLQWYSERFHSYSGAYNGMAIVGISGLDKSTKEKYGDVFKTHLLVRLASWKGQHDELIPRNAEVEVKERS